MGPSHHVIRSRPHSLLLLLTARARVSNDTAEVRPKPPRKHVFGPLRARTRGHRTRNDCRRGGGGSENDNKKVLHTTIRPFESKTSARVSMGAWREAAGTREAAAVLAVACESLGIHGCDRRRAHTCFLQPLPAFESKTSARQHGHPWARPPPRDVRQGSFGPKLSTAASGGAFRPVPASPGLRIENAGPPARTSVGAWRVGGAQLEKPQRCSRRLASARALACESLGIHGRGRRLAMCAEAVCGSFGPRVPARSGFSRRLPQSSPFRRRRRRLCCYRRLHSSQVGGTASMQQP